MKHAGPSRQYHYEHYDPRKNGSYYRIGVAWVTGTGGPCARSEN